jgi:hypothetical protein
VSYAPRVAAAQQGCYFRVSRPSTAKLGWKANSRKKKDRSQRSSRMYPDSCLAESVFDSPPATAPGALSHFLNRSCNRCLATADTRGAFTILTTQSTTASWLYRFNLEYSNNCLENSSPHSTPPGVILPFLDRSCYYIGRQRTHAAPFPSSRRRARGPISSFRHPVYLSPSPSMDGQSTTAFVV